MKRKYCFSLLLGLLLALSSVGQAQTAPKAEPKPSSTATWQQVAPGLEHLQLSRGQKTEKQETGPWFINALRVDTTLISFAVVHAMDEAIGLETVSEMAQRYGALAGINSSFFAMNGRYRGDSVGALMVDGKFFSEPYHNRTAIGFALREKTTTVAFGPLNWSNRLLVTELSKNSSIEAQTEDKSVVINGVNRPLGPDEIVLYTPDFHRTLLMTPDANTHLVYLENGKVFNLVSYADGVTIPCNGYILAAQGKATQWTRKMLQPEAKVSFHLEFSPQERTNLGSWVGVSQIVSGGPRLLRNGSLEIEPEREKFSLEFSATWHPRTAIGRTLDGKVLLVTVDGRQPNLSAGMSLEMLAKLLHEFGAQDAANLDGGGSTTMYLLGKVVNSPSDKTGERLVSDAILLFPRLKY